MENEVFVLRSSRACKPSTFATEKSARPDFTLSCQSLGTPLASAPREKSPIDHPVVGTGKSRGQENQEDGG